MHISLAAAVTCFILTIAVPLIRAQGTLLDGTYKLESLAFDSQPPLVLDLRRRAPFAGTPLIAFPDNGGSNQHWNVTQSGFGYNLLAVAPPSNAFVASLGIGNAVTGTPNDKTTFLFNKVNADNVYQVIVTSDNGAFAIQATTDSGPVTLGVLDTTDPHQTWRVVQV